MPRIKSFGSTPPAKKPRAAPLPTFLELLLMRYGATLNSEQTMEVLHIGRTSLCNLTNSGALKCKMVARHRIFTAVEVYKYLENQTKKE